MIRIKTNIKISETKYLYKYLENKVRYILANNMPRTKLIIAEKN